MEWPSRATTPSNPLGAPGAMHYSLVVEALDKILAGERKGDTHWSGRPSGEAPKPCSEKGHQMSLTTVYGLLIGIGKQFLGNARGEPLFHHEQ